VPRTLKGVANGPGQAVPESAPPSRDGLLTGHWRWRPDWTEGRGCLWWYLTFEDQSELHTAVQVTNRQLSGLTVLDLVPSRWLHLTLREIGYVDKLPSAAAADALAEARRRLSRTRALELSVGPVGVLPGALALRVSPEEAVHGLRAHLPGKSPHLEARDSVPAPDAVPPHVSIGYLRSDVAADTLPISRLPSPSVSVKVSHVTLAEVTRRNRRYEWSTRGLVSLTS
jgi:2'-5' RNA ligase